MSRRVDFWRGVMARQAASGMTVVAFCEREEVSTASFYCWRRRLAVCDETQDRRARGSRTPRVDRPAFLPVAVASGPTACIEIVLPTDVMIRVPDGAERRTILDVLAAVQETAP